MRVGVGKPDVRDKRQQRECDILSPPYHELEVGGDNKAKKGRASIGLTHSLE